MHDVRENMAGPSEVHAILEVEIKLQVHMTMDHVPPETALHFTWHLSLESCFLLAFQETNNIALYIIIDNA